VSPSGPEETGLYLFVTNPRVVELPEEGKITFVFKRGPVTLREGTEERPGSASVDLRLLEICDVCACEVEAREKGEYGESENAIDSLFESLRKEAPETEEEED
jgi:hypothetical protein